MHTLQRDNPGISSAVDPTLGTSNQWILHLPQPALVLDPWGQCLEANAAWAAESGRPPQQLRGHGWLESFTPQEREALLRRLDQEAAAGQPRPVVLEVHWAQPGGALLNLSPLFSERAGGAAGWVVIATSFPVEEPAGPSTVIGQMARFMELLPVPVAMAEDPECRRVRLNPAMQEMFRLDRSTFVREGDYPPVPGVRVLLNHREIPLNRMPLYQAARHGRPVLRQLVRIEQHGEKIFDLITSAVPLRDSDGRVCGALAVYLDVTVQMATSAALEQSRDELRMALLAAESANRSRDRFLAMISHELRTPLTPALVTLTQVLDDLRPAGSESELFRELDLVRRSIELEARLIDDLLDLTRIARGRMRLTCRSLDLHEALRDVIRLIRPRIDTAGLRLEVVLEAHKCQIIGDETRLRQVVWNLLSNAIAYNHPGGSIVVRTSNPAADRVQVDITDTGVGIESQELSGLFLAFEQVQARPRNSEGGLGLGLTISKGLVDLHGGTLRAQSPGTGKGSTFTVELPTADASENAALPGGCGTPRQGSADQLPSLDILLIDDHPDTLRAMRRLLQKLGHRVTTAASIEAARVAIGERGGDAFDLLVSDIGLPDGSGHQIPPLLRKAFPQRSIPAIALSGYGMESDLQASKEAGFDRHLVKPISLDQLQDVIGELTNRAPS